MTTRTSPSNGGGDSRALQFVIEEFIDVEPDAQAPRAEAVKALQARAARYLLPGPQRGRFSRQQDRLMTLDVKDFSRLRHEVRNWLERLVIGEWPGPEGDPPIKGPRMTVRPVAWAAPHRRFEVQGAATHVFWFYFVSLLSRVGLDGIGTCRARRADSIAVCSRLYLRRGRAKVYCSERCRARMATARARGIVYPDNV